jgi:murein DD-endopeptidase MepM/ murein hydrolase activator NlpD
MSRTRWFAAGAPIGAVVAAAALLLAPRPAEADPAPAGEAGAVARSARSVLGPLVDPVGRVAGAGFDRLAVTTATIIAVATPPAPPPVACPAPEARFVDTWGAPRSGGRRHEGVDMMAPHGSPVVAPVGGTVRSSSSALGGLGFWLDGDDGNTYFGSHLASLAVREGRVEPGTPLGTVGTTGNAGGAPHLHFEVMLPGEVSVNPYPFAAAWCPAGVG